VVVTIYEAIHQGVFSNFLLLSAIKVSGLITNVPKPSLLSFLKVTDQVSPTVMKILHKYTHTHVYISIVMFSESRKESKTL